MAGIFTDQCVSSTVFGAVQLIWRGRALASVCKILPLADRASGTARPITVEVTGLLPEVDAAKDHISCEGVGRSGQLAGAGCGSSIACGLVGAARS